MTVTKEAIKWSIRLVALVYGLLVFDDIISCVAPVFYRKVFSLLRLYDLFCAIGGWVFLTVFSLLILHITHIFKLEKKVFWVLITFSLIFCIIVYLDILKNGDS